MHLRQAYRRDSWNKGATDSNESQYAVLGRVSPNGFQIFVVRKNGGTIRRKRGTKFSWKFYNGHGGVFRNAAWSLHYIRCSSRIISHLLPLLWFYKRSICPTRTRDAIEPTRGRTNCRICCYYTRNVTASPRGQFRDWEEVRDKFNLDRETILTICGAWLHFRCAII